MPQNEKPTGYTLALITSHDDQPIYPTGVDDCSCICKKDFYYYEDGAVPLVFESWKDLKKVAAHAANLSRLREAEVLGYKIEPFFGEPTGEVIRTNDMNFWVLKHKYNCELAR